MKHYDLYESLDNRDYYEDRFVSTMFKKYESEYSCINHYIHSRFKEERIIEMAVWGMFKNICKFNTLSVEERKNELYFYKLIVDRLVFVHTQDDLIENFCLFLKNINLDYNEYIMRKYEKCSKFKENINLNSENKIINEDMSLIMRYNNLFLKYIESNIDRENIPENINLYEFIYYIRGI